MLEAFFWVLAFVLSALTLPGTFYLLGLTLAGARTAQPLQTTVAQNQPARLAMIVPAHNEVGGIGQTLANLTAVAASDPATEIVVIADNCSDATAQVAAEFGVTVLERHDTTRRGKGFALDHAFSQLGSDYSAFIIVDADSRIAPDFLQVVRAALATGADALQVQYRVLNSDDTVGTRLADLALMAFNRLRPRGRDALGLSCGIFGNGFVLTRKTLQRVPYTAGSVVEDLEYHVLLVEAGLRVRFIDQTAVYGEMPTSAQGGRQQRARWEGGRVRVLLDEGGALFKGVLAGRVRLLDPLLDLLLLPLGYHVTLLLLALLVPLGWCRDLSLFGLAVVALHVVVAARISGMPLRDLLSLLLSVPRYIVWKLGMLVDIAGASRRNASWVRTQRNHSESEGN